MARTESTAEAVVLILAAGLATRMGGRSKPDLPWMAGRTLLEQAEEMVRAVGLTSVAVTQRSRDQAVVNTHPERGLAESLQVGLRAVRESWGSCPIGILLADQPFVTPTDIAWVYHQFCERPAFVHAVRARYGAVPGHPLFFDRHWDDLVQNLRGDRGLGMLWNTREDVASVDIEVVDRPDPSFDVDTEAAYHQARIWIGEDQDCQPPRSIGRSL